MEFSISQFIDSLASTFQEAANPSIAVAQKAYLRDQFECFGIKTPERRALQKPFMDKKHLPTIEILPEIVKQLWQRDERDFHYFAQEFAFLYKKHYREDDIVWMEWMICHQSWWDTVDMIATKLIAQYFQLYPEKCYDTIQRWLTSDSIWLQRTCLIFQLHYKEATDLVLLEKCIKHLSHKEAFFIAKAIGWILRQYSRTNPDWVEDFVYHHPMQALSKKEALRLIKKTNH